MTKIYKATNAKETMCKELHRKMNASGNPTKLIQPNLFMIVDVYNLQKQVNSLQNRIARYKLLEARNRWRGGLRHGNHK